MKQAYKRCERLDKSNRVIDDLPNDLAALEAHLAADEASLGDVGEDMDKHIVWADPQNKSRTDIALVYIHGFSASRQETAPLSAQLARELGANLFETRLSGHGRGPDGMCDASASNLIEDGKEALNVANRIGKRSVLICTSTGAAIALYLAAEGYKLQPDALVLISPNFWPRSWAARIWSWKALRAPALRISGGYHHWKPANAQQKKYWNTSYRLESVFAMMDLLRLLRDVDLSKIQQPTLMLYSESDRIVSIEAIKRGFEQLGTTHKSLQAIEAVADPTGHILAGDVLSPGSTNAVKQHILAFLDQLPAN